MVCNEVEIGIVPAGLIAGLAGYALRECGHMKTDEDEHRFLNVVERDRKSKNEEIRDND